MDKAEIKNVKYRCSNHCNKDIPYAYVGMYDGLCFECAKTDIVVSLKKIFTEVLMNVLFLCIGAIIVCFFAFVGQSLPQGMGAHLQQPFILLFLNSINFIIIFGFLFTKNLFNIQEKNSVQFMIFFLFLGVFALGSKGYTVSAIFIGLYTLNIVLKIRKIQAKSFKLDIYARKIISVEGKDNKWGAKLVPYKNSLLNNYLLYRDEVSKSKINKPDIKNLEVLSYTKTQGVTDLAKKAVSLDYDEYTKEQQKKEKEKLEEEAKKREINFDDEIVFGKINSDKLKIK